MTTPPPVPFHLAFPVTDLARARDFYGGVLGCQVGRESNRWIDFDFYGHQLVAQLVEPEEQPSVATNNVDDHAVPASHFGAILPWSDYPELVARLERARIPFAIDPYVRFAGCPGEQITLFVRDPSGNYLEFKSFRDPKMLLATDLSSD